MPLGVKPVCTACKTNNSSMWKKGNSGEILCNACCTKNGINGNNGSSNGTSISLKSTGNSNGNGPVLRKSARIKPSKHKFQSTSKPVATKGKSRRIIFKKSQPVKAPTAVSTVVTGESVFHDCTYYQIGDIVSLVDHDGSVYYAQIRGFMKDQYNVKSAVLSWLLPTQSSPQEGFDPTTYILGPEEDLPRKLEYMEFVCHAPSDYYKCRNGPYPTISRDPELCYVWGSMKQPIQLIPSVDEIFGSKEWPKEQIKKKDPPTPKDKTKDTPVKVERMDSS